MLKDEDASVITFLLVNIAYLLLVRNLNDLNLPLSHVSKHTSPQMQTLGFYNTYTEFSSYVILRWKRTQFQTIRFKLFRFWGEKGAVDSMLRSVGSESLRLTQSGSTRASSVHTCSPRLYILHHIFKQRQQSGATGWRAVCKRAGLPRSLGLAPWGEGIKDQ